MPIVVTPTVYESDAYIDDNQLTIMDNVELHKEDEIRILGKDIDLKSLYISIIAILMVFIIWYYTNLIDISLRDNVVLIFTVLLLMNFIPNYNYDISRCTVKYAGPTLWNALPANFKSINSLSTFKKKYKLHLLNQ